MSNPYGAYYWPPLENLPVFDVFVFRNAQNVTDYATNAGNILITNTTSGATYYPTFVDSSLGYELIRTNNPSYTYNANTNTLSANTSGTAAVASAVTVTNTTSGTTYYITFVDASSGSPIVRTYAADLGYDATNQRLKISGITPNNGRNINLNGTPIGNAGNFSSICMGVGAGPASTTIPNNCFCFGGNSGLNLTTGVQNLFIGVNSGNLVTSGTKNTFIGTSAGRKTTTGSYNTQIGGQSQSFPDENFTSNYNTTIGFDCYILTDGLSYSTAIGSGVIASTSNTVRIGRAADTTIFDGVVTNTTTQPASSDNSTKMPTTAWVQTAITAGSVASAVTASNIALITGDNSIGTWWIPYSKTTSSTSNPLYIDNGTTPLSYNPNTSTLTATNFNGLAAQSTLIEVAVDNTATTYYPTFTSTGAGQKALLFDTTTTPLSYVPSTSTLTASIFSGALSGNASTASQVNITNATFGTTYYPIFVDVNTGNADLRTRSATLTYNATSNTLASTNFSGDLIGNASSASAVALTSDDTAGTWWIPFSKTTSLTSNALYIDNGLTPLTYNPNTSTLTATNFNGLAAQSTLIEVAVDNTATTYYPIFTSTGAGQKALLFDTTITPLSYIPSTSTLTATNFSGLAAQSTLIAVTNDNTASTFYVTFVSAGAGQKSLLVDSGSTPLSFVPSTGALTATTFAGDLTGNASTASAVALTGDDTAGTYWLPFSKTNNATNNPLYIDNGLTPLTYNPNTSTLTATTFAGALSGNSSTASAVALTSDDTAGTYWIPFSKTTSATSNTLYIDNSTTPLVYNPFNNELSATQYSLGGLAPASGANAGFFAQNTGSFATVIQNQATSGSIILYTRTALNALTASLSVSSTSANIYAPNITLNGVSNFNMGQGAGDTSNVIIGYSTPRTVVYNASSNNTIIGAIAGTNLNNVTAANNTFVGQTSGQAVTNATNNTFIGRAAGQQTTTGIQNTFIGASSGFQTGGASQGTGNNNVCVGYQSGDSMITTARENTFIGTSAGSTVTLGFSNTMIGYNSGIGAISGGGNVFVGDSSGFQTPASGGTNGFNTCVGYQSGSLMITTASSNTFIGYNAGNSVTTGTNNICIGADSDPLTPTTSNSITIGTVTETMFIQGGFNLRVGAQITATISLASAVLAQFYTVAMTGAGQTITLPNPTGAAYLGATVTFKRKTNTTVFTLTSTGGAGFLPIGSITLSASPITIAATVFQVDLVNDGTNWCIIGQA